MILYRIELTPETKDSKKEPESPFRDKFDEIERYQSCVDDEKRLLHSNWTFPEETNYRHSSKVPDHHCYRDEVHCDVVMDKHLPDIRTDEQN